MIHYHSRLIQNFEKIINHGKLVISLSWLTSMMLKLLKIIVETVADCNTGHVARGVPIGGVWGGGGVTPPFISFVGKICCCRQIQGKGENEKGEERKEGKEKEKRKGKERKENERQKKGKREKGKERREKEKREKEKKKLEKKERKRKEKMREDRKGVCHWQVKIVLSANVGL